MIETYLQKLNEEQIKPVMDTEGPVLVIAGAGSGKTRVLTTRIAYLCQKLNVSAHRILAITFTNKAANEMKERLSTMGIDVDAMWVSTIHSMCVRILRSEGHRLGYDSKFSIYSEQDKDHVIKRILDNAEVSEKDEKLFKRVKFHISNAKMTGLTPMRYAEEHLEEDNISEICRYYALYEEELQKSNALDFDDLLMKTEYLLATYADVRKHYADRFLYVHVDEFQDTNTVQYRIVKHLASVHENLFVVGDDDQSIYGWRGAEIENILGFPKDYPGAKVYKLQRNYRSTKKILDLANCVIAGNLNRNEKQLWTENESGDDIEVYTATDEGGEARYVAQKIRQAIDYFGLRAGDFAVLMRVNALSRSLEQEFNNYNIPYKVYGGFKFFERKEIKDLTAYLRVLNNPLDNEAILRIINLPKRGIGDTTVQTLVQYAAREDLSVFDAVIEVEETSLSSGAKEKVKKFASLIRELMLQTELLPLPDLVRAVIQKTDFNSQFATDSEENDVKKQNVHSFVASVEEFISLNPEAKLADYLSSITLSADTDELGEESTVSLATVHAVKGLEFPVVFIVGLDENIFPISRALTDVKDLEEERRLMYVAVTRAEKQLFLCSAESRYLNGKRDYFLRSRFLRESAPVLGDKVQSFVRAFGPYGKQGNTYGGNSYGGYGSYGERSRSSLERTVSLEELPRTSKSDRYTVDLSATSAAAPQNGKDASSYFGKKPAAATYEKAAKTAYQTGDKVKHPKFGIGTVIEVKGTGASAMVTVAFQGFGIKQLSLSIAPLTKV